MITLLGSGFGDGATVTFDGLPATDVIVVDQTRITCTPPDHADGLVEVIVTNPDGTTGSLDDAFVYTTLSVAPAVGPVAGGTTLTITVGDGGAGVAWFPAGHTFFVFVDNTLRALGVDLTNPSLILNPAHGTELPYVRVSDAELTCVTAAQPCGPTDVVVVDMSKLATSEPNVAYYLPSGFIYQLGAPTLTDVLPTSGASHGGTHVVLGGTFSCATCEGGGTVHAAIGGVPLTSVGCSPTSITGITGVHAAGLVDVVVTNPDGQVVTLAAAYTYVNPPAVASIDPDHGPESGGTDVTITGTGFQVGAGVTLNGAVAFDVVVVSSTLITATTSGHKAAVVDVVVTNPDGQHGTLEQGYGYEGWWLFVPDVPFNLDDYTWPDDIGSLDPFSFTWWIYRPSVPGRGWVSQPLLLPPVDGWWMSIAAYGGDVMVAASSRPKDPRTWGQIATFATGSTAMLGGSPGIAGAFHNRLIYAASDYTVGVTSPPIRIYSGSFDRELCRLPPTAAGAMATAIVSLLVANGTIYLSTLESGSSSADWVGRVFALDLDTAALTPIGAAFGTGHVPYALAWHNGQLWCGTHRQASDVPGKIFRIRPDLLEATWTEDVTLASGSVAALCSWHGSLYAGTTAPAATFGQMLQRAADGTWSAVDTGSGGTATANNGYLACGAFGAALYASYWNGDTPAVAKIRSTTDGMTWTTRYTGAAGTIRPFIVLTVDDGELFAIGGGAGLTAAILRTPDGTTWTDLTAELPDQDKTALPAVAALVF